MCATISTLCSFSSFFSFIILPFSDSKDARTCRVRSTCRRWETHRELFIFRLFSHSTQLLPMIQFTHFDDGAVSSAASCPIHSHRNSEAVEKRGMFSPSALFFLSPLHCVFRADFRISLSAIHIRISQTGKYCFIRANPRSHHLNF